MNITPKEINRILNLDLSNFNAGDQITFCSECDWQTGKCIHAGCDCEAHLHVMEVTEHLMINFRLRHAFAIYERALNVIAFTVTMLKAEAEADGSQLNGHVANEISNDPHFLKKIAHDALNEAKELINVK